MLKYIKRFEQIIVHILIVFMAIVLIFSIIDLGYLIIIDLLNPPFALLRVEELQEILGLFLLILVGLELLEMIKIYIQESIVKIEVVFLVTMTAVARKILIIDIKEISGIILVGLGTVIAALATGYYIIKRGNYEIKLKKNKTDQGS